MTPILVPVTMPPYILYRSDILNKTYTLSTVTLQSVANIICRSGAKEKKHK